MTDRPKRLDRRPASTAQWGDAATPHTPFTAAGRRTQGLGSAGRSAMTPDTLNQFADPLGEALHSLRMSGVFYCHSELTAPWGAQMPALPHCLMFHLVVHGRCWLAPQAGPGAGTPQALAAQAAGRWLEPGDFVLVPHGRGHVLGSAPGVPTPPLFDLPREPLSERYEVLRHGGGGEVARIVCGAVRFDHPAARQLVALLPPVVCIATAGLQPGGWLPSLLHLMADEARQMRPGGEALVTRLADILVIQAIRHWLQHDAAAQGGWLGALKDPRVGRALARMQHDPARGWTVATLAEAAAMSRSAFAQRFTALVGMPVLAWLTQWRMGLAQAWLAEGQAMAEVAARTGYQSEAAFSRAFKRSVGAAPGGLRRRAPAQRPGGTRPKASASVR